MQLRPLCRSDAPDFQRLRLAALQEAPEAFGSTYEEDVLLPLDVVADRIAEVTVPPGSSCSVVSSMDYVTVG